MKATGKCSVSVEDQQKAGNSEKDPLLSPEDEPVSRQYAATFIASLISMGTGCAGGWSAAAVPLLMNGLASDLGGIKTVSEDEASWVTSLLNLGSLVGSLPAGHLSYYWGRRKFLLYLGVLLIFAWLLIIYNFNNVGLIYLGRFICGFVAGAVCIALAMYSNEVCSDPIRGRSGCFYDMMQVFGILFVYIVTAVFPLYWASNLCMLIPVIFIAAFYWMPESPVYLIKHRRQLDAIDSIRWFHGENSNVEKHLTRINLALLEGKEDELLYDEEPAHYWASMRQFFRSLSKTTIKSFTLVLFLFVIQRNSGAPIVVYYTRDVFDAAHSSVSSTDATIYTGVAQLICTALSFSFIDCLGRRFLLIFSFTTMIASLFIFLGYIHFASLDSNLVSGLGWIPVLTISIFVGIFRLGVGPIPWFMCAELIPIEAQRWALPVILFIAWGISFMCSKTYLAAVDVFGFSNVFAFFIIMCVLGLLETIFLLPETKNKSRVQIQEALGTKPSQLEKLRPVILIEN